MYLLDTDHISLMDKGTAEGERIRQRLSHFSEDEIAASIVSYEEQMRGWLAQIAQLRAVEKHVQGY